MNINQQKPQLYLCGMVLVALTQLIQCTSAQSLNSHFSGGWQWDGGTSAQNIMLALEGSQSVSAPPAAVGVTGRGLIGRALPNGAPWSYTGQVDVLPSIVGNLVAFSGAGKVTGLDVRTGEQVFSVPSENRRLEGMGYDGHFALLLLVDTHAARADELAIVGPQGNLLSRASTKSRLGTPAVVNGIALVPWDGQYITAFYVKTGEEIGRMLVRDAIHTLKAVDDEVYVYGRGVQKLNQRLVDHPGSISLRLDLPKYPGEPVWPVDGSKPRPARAQPILILTHPSWAEDRAEFSSNTYGLTYHDLVAGYDALHHHLKWVAHFPAAISGGHANQGSMTVCLESGQISQLRLRDGYHQEIGSLGSPVKACVVNGLDGVTAGGSTESLAEQVYAALDEVGPDMFAMQTRFVDEIAKKPGADYTRVLLLVAQSPSTTGLLRNQLKRALANRQDGAEVMIAELLASAPEGNIAPSSAGEPALPAEQIAEKIAESSEDDDWAAETSGELEPIELDETLYPAEGPSVTASSLRKHRRPPLIEVAQALTQMQANAAAPALALHLNTTGLESENSLALVKALLALGDLKQVYTIRQFIEEHKNTGGDKQQREALALATLFLYKHDPFAHSYLQIILQSSLTHIEVRYAVARGLQLMKLEEKNSALPSIPLKNLP